MRRLTTAQLDALQAAARSGDRGKHQKAVYRMRIDTHSDGFGEGYRFAFREVALRIRREGGGQHQTDLLVWLDQEARRS